MLLPTTVYNCLQLTCHRSTIDWMHCFDDVIGSSTAMSIYYIYNQHCFEHLVVVVVIVVVVVYSVYLVVVCSRLYCELC